MYVRVDPEQPTSRRYRYIHTHVIRTSAKVTLLKPDKRRKPCTKALHQESRTPSKLLDLFSVLVQNLLDQLHRLLDHVRADTPTDEGDALFLECLLGARPASPPELFSLVICGGGGCGCGSGRGCGGEVVVVVVVVCDGRGVAALARGAIAV